MKIIDYELQKDKLIKEISLQKIMVLATSNKNIVGARSVFCVSNGLDIFIITSKAYDKYKQLSRNLNVALCFNNTQIIGIAELLGHPFSYENSELLKNCPNLNDEFMYFGKYKNSILIKVKITKIEQWINNGREYLEVCNNKAYRIG